MINRIKSGFSAIGRIPLNLYQARHNKQVLARNQAIARANKERKAKKEPYHAFVEGTKWNNWMHVYRKSFRQRKGIFNPNTPGNCSAYATRIAESFGKRFVFANAWDLAAKNVLVYEVKKEEGGISRRTLGNMIRLNKITPGTVIGIYCIDSQNNRPDRKYTHVAVYRGNGIFWHNYEGPNVLTFKQLFNAKTADGQREFIPVAVIEPKSAEIKLSSEAYKRFLKQKNGRRGPEDSA